VTRTPLSRSEGQRSTCLMGKKGIACANILLCFALLWQCWHKLGKIAQCLLFRVVVVVCLLANWVVNSSLWRFRLYLQLIVVRLAGGGGILCRHVHSLLLLLLLLLLLMMMMSAVWLLLKFYHCNGFSYVVLFHLHIHAKYSILSMPFNVL